MIERTFPDGLHIPINDEGAKAASSVVNVEAIRRVVEKNAGRQDHPGEGAGSVLLSVRPRRTKPPRPVLLAS
jgi:hypothetical protein